MSSGLPLPKADADGAPYWSAAAEGVLQVQDCSDCGHLRFYPRLLCPMCHSDRAEWRACAGTGTVYSYSIVRRSPVAQFVTRVPYVVALIDLDEKVRLLSNVLCDVDEVHIGSRVEVAFRAETNEIGVPEFTLIDTGADL